MSENQMKVINVKPSLSPIKIDTLEGQQADASQNQTQINSVKCSSSPTKFKETGLTDTVPLIPR